MDAVARVQGINIFIGPPGSGKGSVSRICTQGGSIVQLSTGNLCRQHIAEGTEIGRRIDLAIKSGKLIPDELVSTMVLTWLRTIDSSVDVILDGYPRTEGQARALHDFLQESPGKYRVQVFVFSAPDDAVLARILARRICSNSSCQAVYSATDVRFVPQLRNACDYCGAELMRRADDYDGPARDRVETYHRHARELIKFYEHSHYRMVTVDASQDPQKILSEIRDAIGVCA